VRTSLRTILLSLFYVAVAGLIARLGRIAVDWVLEVRPTWAGVARPIGGLLIALLVGVLAAFPLFRLYGWFDNGRRPPEH
jgi:hypothetical protein